MLMEELASWKEAGLLRELRRVDGLKGVRLLHDGREWLAFASNDYLGLAGHPLLREAAMEAVRTWGTGSAASRLICGSLAPHHALEDAVARWKGTAAALAFSTGYAAAMGTIPALVGSDDVVIVDKLVHACCVDAARLSGARLRVFRHNDLDDLEAKLKWADSQRATGREPTRRPRILVVAESVYSMDGDLASVREIVELKRRFGAWLMLDEAHAAGLFGERRSGLAEAFGVGDGVDVHMGTLGKAVGAAGGYIAGSRPLVDLLVNRARSFVFSTAPVPAQAAAARAGIELIAGPEGAARAERLWALVDLLKNELIRAGWAPGLVRSAILPLIVGDESRAMEVSAHLRNAGLLVPAIRYPTVARGSARLRVTVSAAHTREDVQMLATALSAIRRNPHPADGQTTHE